MKRPIKRNGFLGYALFFLLVAFTITVAMLFYGFVNQKSGGNLGIIAAVMALVIIVLTGIFTAVDAERRKKTVDEPTERILDATERIASGDFSVRLTPRHTADRYDEYDAIMENLNVMAQELGKNEVLKTDFISNVSHELKTPLNVIRNYTALLSDPALSEQERAQYAATVVSATERLSALVDNVLRLNKLEHSTQPVVYAEFDLSEALAEAILAHEDAIEAKGICIECDIAEGVRITSSKSLLDTVWHNLIGNAVKFTDAGGTVGVSLSREEQGICIEVRDTGCGIDAETGARIFDKFYQGDTSHASQGNGLGLALVKKVIDVLGGEITVKSRVGEGSTFAVVIRDGAQ